MTAPNYYSDDQVQLIDRDNRVMAAAGLPMSGELEDIRDQINLGNIGIKSDARDVDSMSGGGGQFRRDEDTYDGSTLQFGWKASWFSDGVVKVLVSAGSLTLTGGTVNYVEADYLGTVYCNTSGFTQQRLPLWIITTSSTTYTANNVVAVKSFLTILRPISGLMMSAPAQTKEVDAQLGASIAATTSFLVQCPNVAAVLARATLIVSTAITASDTDYWTIGIVNLGAAGAGTTAMVDATSAANSTKVTGGTAIAAYTPRDLTLSGTDADLITVAKDVLKLTLTKNGSPAALTLATLSLDFTFQT